MLHPTQCHICDFHQHIRLNRMNVTRLVAHHPGRARNLLNHAYNYILDKFSVTCLWQRIWQGGAGQGGVPPGPPAEKGLKIS